MKDDEVELATLLDRAEDSSSRGANNNFSPLIRRWNGTETSSSQRKGLFILLLLAPWLVWAFTERQREIAVTELSQLRSEQKQSHNATTITESNALQNSTANSTNPNSGTTREEPPDEDDPYVIHTIDDYNDLHYRRVCAPVHSSHICLTMRYPFPIPRQDPTLPYAHPVAEQFYQEPVHVHFVDGEELAECEDDNKDGDAIVKDCIELHRKPEDTLTAIGVWSRIREDEDGAETHSLFGIDSDEQRRKMHDYFRNTVVMVLGASPSPPITDTLKQLFDECQQVDKWDGLGSLHPFKGFQSLKHGQDVCLPQDTRDDSLTRWMSLQHQDEWTMLLHDGFYPQDHGHTFYNHSIPANLSVAEEMEKIQAFSGWDHIKFSLIIEHPIAHIQNQDLMERSYDYIVSLQNTWTQVFLNATRGEKYKKLRAKGLEFNLIGFDGSPQFFPTESGAYTGMLHKFANEDEFLAQGGYEGWTPALGSRCRGFLPPTSNLTQFNQLGRDFYEQNGLDMRWYGRTWEFINMVWFSVKGTMGWGPKGLDCTHGGGSGAAVSNIHKFFLMAMVDDHFDSTGVELP